MRGSTGTPVAVPERGHGRAGWTRLRWSLAGGTAAVASAVLLFVDGRGVHVGLSPLGLVVCLFWALALALCAALVRTRAGSVLLGTCLRAATFGLLISTCSSDASTASLGVVVAPVELAALVAVGLGADAVGQAFPRRRSPGLS